VILLDHIIQVLALAQANATRQRALGFQRLDGCRIGGVLVHVQHPWHGTTRCFYGFNKEALRRRRIPFRRQQKLDRLARGVDRTVQIPVLAIDPYISLVYPVGLVGGPKMWPATLIEFLCIRWTHRQTQLASAARPRSASISAACSYASGYRRYHRTAKRITSPE
jgi:hypothetical protein